MEYLYSAITDKIIRAAYTVHNTLGFGFVEKLYENALVVELQKMGLQVECQKPLTVWYKGEAVGDYCLDMLVEGKIIVEVKAVKQVIDAHEIQILNYLKGCVLEVGLLLNFGESLEVKRKFFSPSGQSEKSGAKKQ
jgi:GxxExxY protein